MQHVKKIAAAAVGVSALVTVVHLSITKPVPGVPSLNPTTQPLYVSFRPNRSSAFVQLATGGTKLVTKPDEFMALTNSLWPDIEQSKWQDKSQFYKIQFK